MSDNTMPERITQRDARHRPVEYIRADVAQAQLDAANARIAELEGNLSALHYDCNLYHEMTQQQLKGIHKLQTHIIERDARIAELEAKQWDVIAQKFIDLDEHIMATAISVGCDSVASMARELVKERSRIAELEAALQLLCDLQNGPPLIRDTVAWHNAMEKAHLLLSTNSKGQTE